MRLYVPYGRLHNRDVVFKKPQARVTRATKQPASTASACFFTRTAGMIMVNVPCSGSAWFCSRTQSTMVILVGQHLFKSFESEMIALQNSHTRIERVGLMTVLFSQQPSVMLLTEVTSLSGVRTIRLSAKWGITDLRFRVTISTAILSFLVGGTKSYPTLETVNLLKMESPFISPYDVRRSVLVPTLPVHLAKSAGDGRSWTGLVAFTLTQHARRGLVLLAVVGSTKILSINRKVALRNSAHLVAISDNINHCWNLSSGFSQARGRFASSPWRYHI